MYKTITKEQIQKIASTLPQDATFLKDMGWEDISHPAQIKHHSYTFRNSKYGLTIRFDIAMPGATGYGGINHFHIYNPNSTNKHDRYLDKYGNPVAKNSKRSHILPIQTRSV